jgi:hypothetical protein
LFRFVAVQLVTAENKKTVAECDEQAESSKKLGNESLIASADAQNVSTTVDDEEMIQSELTVVVKPSHHNCFMPLDHLLTAVWFSFLLVSVNYILMPCLTVL